MENARDKEEVVVDETRETPTPTPTTNTNTSSARKRYALQAMQLLEEGKFPAALQLLNHCLGESDDTEPTDLEAQVEDLISSEKSTKKPTTELNTEECSTDENSLIEKRCLVHMRLKRYSKVIHDAKKMLDFSGENSVAYKCLLAALCKMKKLEQANEVIRLWQRNSPRDLEMMECRTKLENLMVAVKNGIEASDAFSDVEDLLGLNYDWLLLRKSKDPQWKYRALPTSSRCSFVLCLQYRFGHCSLGEKCPDAHGEAELEEWKKRFEIESVSRKLNSIKLEDGMSYVKNLLAKIQTQEGTTDTDSLFEDNLEELKVSSNSPLHATVQQRNAKKTWKLTAKTTKPLTHVALLHEHHRQYFHISSCSIIGPGNSVILSQTGKSDLASQILTPHLTEAALGVIGVGVSTYSYKVKVTFTADKLYGTFRQSVVFDVGSEKKVIRNLGVDVVPPSESEKSSTKENSISPVDAFYRNNIPWNFGNAEMIDGNNGEKVSSDRLGFALMGSVKTTKAESFMENTKDPLSKEHYKERMRFLLTQEERARQEILAKYNVRTEVTLSEKYVVSGGYNEGMTRFAVDGALYGRINLFRDISEDTAVGRLILRSCNAVLLAKSEESRKQKNDSSKMRVYFCPISDKTKNSVYLDLGKRCVAEMDLRDDSNVQLDIQFQLDRTAFIEQKKVIDQLEEEHLDLLFPDLEMNCTIPWNPVKQWSEIENSKYRLNPKQKEALIAITAENCKSPPILVIGPFGSGKTFTLAQCIRKILTQEGTRVMVCTHSNSAADLYIKEYLDSWVKDDFPEARPLRIYYEMRNLSSVHPVVLQYCLVEAMKFRPPTYDEVMNHRVIVVTLSTSYLLMQMNLPEDTFSHILLDEAAQAMESEAITPLMSAGENTKLVLAGDHFQLSPELFSEEARNIHPSLLERLHALYPDTHPCKLMLCENYRSHSAIIQFVSDSFYTKKLECSKSQPVHDNFYPVTFFAARGEDVQDSESTSYYNMAEVFELTEKITELISSWPEKWGDYRDENAIGVLTPYADQVTRIRSRLRKKGLHSVSVERVFNVQGKQFRAVFLSTVRTFRPWVRILPEAVGNEVDLGFFSSPKLLNTALTRAQSLVAVVGDPVSLCSVGKCRRIWEDYIRICHERKSLFGITYLQLKQNILGVEMRMTWGLNPLASEFQPQKATQIARVNVTVTSISQCHHATAPLAISNSASTTMTPNPPMYGTARAQPQPHSGQSQQRPQYLLPEPQGLYYGVGVQHHQPHPSYPEYAVQNQVLNGPHNPQQQQHPGYYSQPAMQQPVLRPPYHGGYGMAHGVPVPVPTQVSPGLQTLGPWNQGVGPTMPFHQSYMNSRPSGHGVQVGGGGGMPHMYGNSVNPPMPGGPSPAHPNHVNDIASNLPGHSNPNFPLARNNTTPQLNYATGQPLYRRSGNSLQGTGLGLPLPTLTTPAAQAPVGVGVNLYHTPGFEDHNLGMYKQQSYQQVQAQNHHSHQNQITQQQQHQLQSYSTQKLTPQEVNFINRALEQQASSGEPFYGDVQTLRVKLMQAISSGEIVPAAQPQPQPNQHSSPSIGPIGGNQPISSHYPVQLQLQSHVPVTVPLMNHTHNLSHTLASSKAGFTPIPQKSPMQPQSQAERMGSAYNNGLATVGVGGYHNNHEPVQGQIQNHTGSLWPNTNASFPTLTDGFSSDSQNESLLQQQQQRSRGLLDGNGRFPPYAHNQVQSLSTNNTFPSIAHVPVTSRPLAMSGYNNSNSISLSHNNSDGFGYHTDVVGGLGLKAQLSGGLRQGFAERSAFSRVNGGQDIDLPSSDTIGLGRSYANVVKAAAVTAAVGAGVSSSSSASSGRTQQAQTQVHIQPQSIPSVPYSNPQFYNNTVSMNSHGHNHFGH